MQASRGERGHRRGGGRGARQAVGGSGYTRRLVSTSESEVDEYPPLKWPPLLMGSFIYARLFDTPAK